MHKYLAVAAALVSASCAIRPFRIVPAQPDYLLRSPDAKETPFSDIQRLYYHSDLGGMSLGPLTRLRVENAYYEKGAPKRGINRYLGTELAVYRVEPRGLRLLAAPRHLPDAPDDQLPVEELIRPAALGFRHYSLFLQVVLSRKSDRHGAVLLGGNSSAELDRLSAQMTADPDSVCGETSLHCTVFPEACSVSVEIEITVNGTPRTVVWATRVGALLGPPGRPVTVSDLHITRLSRRHRTPVLFDLSDRNTLSLPLLPGDRIDWAPLNNKN